MVAAVQPTGSAPDLRLVTEFRGAVGRLFTEGKGEIIISGPAGTGKTRSILEWIHWRCENERIRVLILRKTHTALVTSALVTFNNQVLHAFDGKRSVLDGVTFFGGNKILPPEYQYEATGSAIVTGGMDTITKVLSTEYDVIYINECTELTLDDWELIGNRTDRPTMDTTRPESLLLGDCNPDVPHHWIKQREKSGQLQLWVTTHKDNPSMWDRVRKCWTASGERYLARLRKNTGVRRLRMLEGKWVAAEGQVYEAWDPNEHLLDINDLRSLGVLVE